MRRGLGARPEAVADDLTTVIGNTGAAHASLLLTDVLDRAEPGQIIAVVQLADGCDVWLLRTTEAIATYAPALTVRQQLEGTRDDLTYAAYLTWRGFLRREPPRRPEPDRPAAPPSLRGTAWKYGLIGSRDEGGFVHLPPSRVSMESGAIDQMTDGAHGGRAGHDRHLHRRPAGATRSARPSWPRSSTSTAAVASSAS